MQLTFQPLGPGLIRLPRPLPAAVVATPVVASGDQVHFSTPEQFVPVRPQLSAPEPSPKAEETVRQLFGQDFSLDQLKASVGDCLPGAIPIVKLGVGGGTSDPSLNFSVDWRGEQGQQLASSTIQWRKQPSGALTLQWRDVWLDPEQRQNGFFEKLAGNQIQLLLDKSKHPDSVLELAAGGSQGLGQDQKEIVGKYLWAKLGLFEFSRPEVQQRVADSFAGWLKEKAGQHPELTPALVDGLCKSAQTWTRPEQYAELDVPFFRLPTERHGREVPVALGKAFLLDAHTSGWLGTCKINQIDPEILERAQRALAFGGRSQRESEGSAPTSENTVRQLQAMASDGQRSLRERQQHAESLAALQDQFDPAQMGKLFADLAPVQAFCSAAQNLDPSLPAEQRSNLVFQAVIEGMRHNIVQECQQQTGRTFTPEQIKDARVRNFLDLSAFRSALLSAQSLAAI